MNCATMMPEDRYFYDKERSVNNSGHDRRISRGLASCLRGESEECHDYEAEGNLILILQLFFIFSYFLYFY